MEKAILDKALLQIEKRPRIQAEWKEYRNGEKGIDAEVHFQFGEKHNVIRFVEVRKEIREHHIPALIEKAKKHQPFMLIVYRLYPNLRKLLDQENIDWLDGAGNMHLRDDKAFIWIDRHTTTPVKEKKNRAFTKTGLKVVFLFLHEEEWLNRTYREIAEMAGVALGNIKHVLDGLKEHRFVLAVDDKNLKLVNKEELLNQWMTAFTDELKPKIRKGFYRFRNEQIAQNWRNLELSKGTVWGGEPAADILTNGLKPMQFTLYTTLNRAELMKQYHLTPDENGNVEIFEPYWNIRPEKKNVAPLLTVYTDLMTTGDPRNTKIAKLIYEQFIVNTD